MNFRKLNVSVGWLIFAIASALYLMTIEPTASFWDCGEFIATAYKLEVGHPPGAPFFMLLGRLFSMFTDPESAAAGINVLSALCSSFTILFLFWTITALAKKMALKSGELTQGKTLAIIGSGVVGALAYTFSDSFWFSAVEGEVYAMSSLFTACVFWAILKWDSDTSHYSDRWLILIAYLMGLSIGVHLLNLLAIPAMAFVYYFKKKKPTKKGILLTGLISFAILGFIQAGIIPGVVKMAGVFELFLVNNMGLPFNTGVILYALFTVAAIVLLTLHASNPRKSTKLGLVILAALAVIPILGNDLNSGSEKITNFLFVAAIGAAGFLIKKRSPLFHTAVVSVAVILIGYSTFSMIVIRSAANPPMDENNPENIFTLLSFLNREQYGDRPLLHGNYWMAPIDPTVNNGRKDGKPVWMKAYVINSGNRMIASFNNRFDAQKYIEDNPKQKITLDESYIISDDKKNAEYVYNNKFSALFPRMYSSQSNHVDAYKRWSKFVGIPVRTLDSQGNQTVIKKPTMVEDLRFFLRYQVNWMYWRYFMWNFSGRQNDIQGHGNILEGNWQSGIPIIDSERLGNQKELPSSITTNPAHNLFYMLPFLLGLIGLFYHLYRDRENWFVVLLLFLLTGMAVVVYLNQYPMQPRERDYAYVGSFYSFAIWIGLGIFALFDSVKNLSWTQLKNVSQIIIGAGAGLLVIEFLGGTSHYLSYSILYLGIVGLALIALMKYSEKVIPSAKGRAVLATVLGLTVPILMLAEGFDDHNRAKRRTGVDFAKNYLISCDENAILFTNGDNDTFPLWYVQEVEGFRTDVRVVNLSLLNTDWYIDQMKRRAYDSDPVPFSLTEPKYRQGTRDIVLLNTNLDNKDPKKIVDIKRAINFVADDNNQVNQPGLQGLYYFPSNKFSLAVNLDEVLNSDVVTPADSNKIQTELVWQMPGNYVLKNNLMMLDLLANFNWERPIYYAVTTGPDTYVNLEKYFKLEGFAYRLTPVLHDKDPNPNKLGGVNTEKMYDNVMNKFQWGGMDSEDIYMDENNLRMTTNMRLQLANLAEELIEEGKDDKALDIVDKAMEAMPERNVPVDRILVPLIDIYYQLGEDEKANDLSKKVFQIYEENLNFYNSLDPEFASSIKNDMDIAFLGVLKRLELMATTIYPQPELSKEYADRIKALEPNYNIQVEAIDQLRKKQKNRVEF